MSGNITFYVPESTTTPEKAAHEAVTQVLDCESGVLAHATVDNRRVQLDLNN